MFHGLWLFDSCSVVVSYQANQPTVKNLPKQHSIRNVWKCSQENFKFISFNNKLTIFPNHGFVALDKVANISAKMLREML